MTVEAVKKFIDRGVVNGEFRQKLVNLEMTPEEIAAVDPDLDSEDLNAIKTALLFNLGDFTDFRASITMYINFRYRHAGPSGLSGPSGDDLPISV